VVPESQRCAQDMLAEDLRAAGHHVRQVCRSSKTRGQLLSRPCVRSKRHSFQMLVGHTDTVWPLGTLASMPFERQGPIIKGPGVFDMKGGLAQLVFALRHERHKH
jgi:glutamate carboxypeptidase